ncbi:26175_t:CDS:2, partial [Dentiscutata erythropus]
NEISNQNLSTFIDNNIWGKALYLPLLGVNKMAVDNNEVLALHEEKDVKAAIKEFDELTLDLPIPTNYNIVA